MIARRVRSLLYRRDPDEQITQHRLCRSSFHSTLTVSTYTRHLIKRVTLLLTKNSHSSFDSTLATLVAHDVKNGQSENGVYSPAEHILSSGIFDRHFPLLLDYLGTRCVWRLKKADKLIRTDTLDSYTRYLRR